MTKDVGTSEDSYINKRKAREVITVLQKYDECLKAESSRQLLPSTEVSKVTLEIDLKKVPLNKSIFINVFGPLPKPFKYETDIIDVCLMVKDPDPKKPLKDRELDLENTREIYRDALIEAGFSDDFINNRLVIMPMRELFTEYREHEAKSKLSKSYDVFLADRKLIANKFSGLKQFLGTHFWVKHKKLPFPVDLSLRGKELKDAMLSALASTALYVTGKGTSCSVTIGLKGQPPGDLTANLVYVLQKVNKIFGRNVSTLKIVSNNSSGNIDPIPFFVDLASPNELDDAEIAPRNRLTDKIKPAVGELSLFDDVFVTVTGPGKFCVAEKRKKRKMVDDGQSDDEDEEAAEDGVPEDAPKVDRMVERVKAAWIEKTQKMKKKRKSAAPKKFRPSESVASGKPKRNKRQLIDSKTG